MLLTDYCRLVEVILCALVLQQPQVSSCVETAANDVQFAVEVTDGGVNLQPVIVLETLDLTR